MYRNIRYYQKNDLLQTKMEYDDKEKNNRTTECEEKMKINKKRKV